MAKSAVDICNKALGRLGITEYIADLATDQSEEAGTCNVFYADLLDSCLAAFPWPFATLRATLAVKADEPVRDGWRHVFALPADCLQARAIWPAGLNAALPAWSPPLVTMNPRTPRNDQRIPFDVERSSTDDSRVILCDLDAPVLFYTARVSDPSKFPADFADAFAWLLASEIAMPLTKDQKRAALVQGKFEQKIHEAWARALTERQEDVVPDSEMITGRL